LGDPLKGNLLLFYKPLHLEAQQVSTRIEVRRHHTPSNFKKEKIKFEVVDWPSQYHAILGRLVFARFMAVPHYAFLKPRMPANRGPLTISGSFARSENCDKDFNSMSQTFGVHEELHHIREATNMDIDPPAQQNAPELSFDASKDT
jgi:hypothetical protein